MKTNAELSGPAWYMLEHHIHDTPAKVVPAAHAVSLADGVDLAATAAAVVHGVALAGDVGPVRNVASAAPVAAVAHAIDCVATVVEAARSRSWAGAVGPVASAA